MIKTRKCLKKLERTHSWQDENKHHKQPLILEQSASWVVVDTTIQKQNNMSGDWVFKMADNRAEHRRMEHKSDWLFDRADARKLKRERQHVTGNWYFERARGRAYCRFHPHSNWCRTGTYSGPNFDRLHQSDYENDYNEGDISHHAAHWSKKFILHSSAAAGKLMKRSFSHFQSKVNYHNHR